MQTKFTIPAPENMRRLVHVGTFPIPTPNTFPFVARIRKHRASLIFESVLLCLLKSWYHHHMVHVLVLRFSIPELTFTALPLNQIELAVSSVSVPSSTSLSPLSSSSLSLSAALSSLSPVISVHSR